LSQVGSTTLPACRRRDLAEVALGRVNILRREHPVIPLATARDGAAFKRHPYLSKLTLSPRERSKPGTSLTGVGGIRDMAAA
jgi:hypothetical protein